jgi:hypothetical protein
MCQCVHLRKFRELSIIFLCNPRFKVQIVMKRWLLVLFIFILIFNNINEFYKPYSLIICHLFDHLHSICLIYLFIFNNPNSFNYSSSLILNFCILVVVYLYMWCKRVLFFIPLSIMISHMKRCGK